MKAKTYYVQMNPKRFSRVVPKSGPYAIFSYNGDSVTLIKNTGVLLRVSDIIELQYNINQIASVYTILTVGIDTDTVYLQEVYFTSEKPAKMFEIVGMSMVVVLKRKATKSAPYEEMSNKIPPDVRKECLTIVNSLVELIQDSKQLY